VCNVHSLLDLLLDKKKKKIFFIMWTHLINEKNIFFIMSTHIINDPYKSSILKFNTFN
jgi:hypothetical protein